MRANRTVGVLALLLAIVAAEPAFSAIGPRWTAAVQPPPLNTMPDHGAGLTVADNGDTLALVGMYPSNLFAIDGSTGSVRWRRRSRADFFGQADIAPSGDRIILTEGTALVPGSEEVEEELFMLDRDGRVLWRLSEVRGGLRFSPLGQYLLAFDPQTDSGVNVYRVSDGTLVWHTSPDEIGQMRNASFTAEEKKILVHTAQRVIMFTVEGDLLWSMAFPKGADSASTSDDGSITAVLTGGLTPKFEPTENLVIIDQAGQELFGTELVRYKAFEPPDIEAGIWDSVQVSGDGSLIILGGLLPGVHRLQAVDPVGNLLWDKRIPFLPSGSSFGFKALKNNVILAALYGSDGTTFHFLNGAGETVQTVEMPGLEQGAWRVSPNGSFMSTVVNSNIQSFAVPLVAGESPMPTGQTLISPDKQELRVWVGLRQSLSPAKWIVKYDASKKAVAATSADGGRELRLRVGSREALVNGREVILPAAPRIMRDRVIVPSMVLEMLARA